MTPLVMTKRMLYLVSCLAIAAGACGGRQDLGPESTASAFLAGDADSRYTEGMLAWRDGDTETAELKFRQALEANGRYLAAHIALGDLLLDVGRVSEAVNAFDSAIALRNTSIDAHLGRARSLTALGDLDGAAESARTAASLSVSSGNRELEAETHAVEGAILSAQGDTNGAIEAFERALSLSAGTTEARIGLAHLYAAANRMPDAVRVLGRAAQYETAPDKLLQVGRTFHDFGVYDRAIEALEVAYAAAPDNLDIMYYYASSAVRSGRDDLGIQLASTLIGRAPDYLAAYVVRGEATLKRGYVGNARSDAETVLTADPQHYDALILLGDIDRESEDIEGAVADYEAAIAAAPERLRALEHLADLHFSQNDFEPFVMIVQANIERSDRPEGWLEMLVDALIRLGRDAEAVPYQSELANERESDHALNYDVASRALANPGTLPAETVLAHARRAVEHVGGAPLPYRATLIDALILNGLEDEAMDVLERAENLFPNSTELRERRRQLR